jgi:hypothetical protein
MLNILTTSLVALILAAETWSTPTPDNTCGEPVGYTCDASLAHGGSCCSPAGYCGSTSAYCGTGCQSDFGTCSSSMSSSNPTKASSKMETKTKSRVSSTASSSVAPSIASCTPTVLPNVGTFTHSTNYTFLTSTFPSDLSISTYPVGNAPYTHLFASHNARLAPPYLELVVPGSQPTPGKDGSNPILSAQISTAVKNILFASVRTTMILSPEPGTCQAAFFYASDQQEIDIEFLSNSSASSNMLNSVPMSPAKWTKAQRSRLPLHLTNQKATSKSPQSAYLSPSPAGLYDGEHEYRFDWTAEKVVFYVDGVVQSVITENVPTQAGPMLWSNWADGSPGWSTGPPKGDSVLRIKSIVMWYNTTGNVNGGAMC